MTTAETGPGDVSGGEQRTRVATAGTREHRAPGGNGVQALTQGLGWLSVGLGLAEAVAPRGVARLIGVPDEGENRALLRALGLREIATGAGILSRPRPAAWLWGRVAGDALDLALLAAAFRSPRAHRGRLAGATAGVLGVTVLDALCSSRLGEATATGTVDVRHSITVNRPPEDVYRFWRDAENLPRFMRDLESVRAAGDRRAHFTAKGPAGTTVEWDAEITEEQPGALIAWRSLGGARVATAGSVRFAPGPRGRGTVVTVGMQYRPPGGAIGATVARLLGREPGQHLGEDLRHLKQLLETGEIATARGPAARSRPSLYGR